MNQHYLQLYADFIVKVGVNVRPRQNFIVRCPVTMPDFAHACVRAGYEAGAKTVVVRWEDDKLTRLNMELADEKDLTAMKPYELRSYLDYAEDPDGCCTLAIHAEDPEALAGLDAGKLNRVNLARRTFMKPWQEYTMNDRVQWCVAAVPAPGWAAKVFPELPLDEAVEKLWALIFDVCRVSTGDPVGAWQKHVAVTKARRDRMNALELDRIHMTSSNGTDLTVGLADDATWEGASSKTEDGIEFIANVPTVWDESIALDGCIGEYIVTARRKGDTWYVGAMTDWKARELVLDLSFLGGSSYTAELFRDGANAAKIASDYCREKVEIPLDRRLRIAMAPGGGCAIKIVRR